jgi:hypothetical protein|tara:strand:+ start:451 stop:1134 length:684 start_codon:yes stop_codon:yes gene_type:complete
MNYIDILLKLNKSKKILFSIFLIFMITGHLLQKFNSKIYEFNFNIFFPTGSFLSFSSKDEIYKNFQNSILTELVKKNYKIKRKQNLDSAYTISTTVVGNNSEDYIKKKKEVIDLFKIQKKNLIRWITNSYNITNITYKELPEKDSFIDSRREIKLELMWIDLEKEFVFENITEKNNIKFPKNLTLRNKTNYYAIMAVLFVAFLVLYASYLIINDDFRKKIKKIKKIK